MVLVPTMTPIIRTAAIIVMMVMAVVAMMFVMPSVIVVTMTAILTAGVVTAVGVGGRRFAQDTGDQMRCGQRRISALDDISHVILQSDEQGRQMLEGFELGRASAFRPGHLLFTFDHG